MRFSRSVKAGLLVLALMATPAGSYLIAGGPHGSHKTAPETSMQSLLEQMSDMMQHMSTELMRGQMSPRMTRETGEKMSRMSAVLKDMVVMLESPDAGSAAGGHEMMMGRHGKDMQKKMGRMSAEMAKMHQSMMGSEEQTSTSHDH